MPTAQQGNSVKNGTSDANGHVSWYFVFAEYVQWYFCIFMKSKQPQTNTTLQPKPQTNTTLQQPEKHKRSRAQCYGARCGATCAPIYAPCTMSPFPIE